VIFGPGWVEPVDLIEGVAAGLIPLVTTGDEAACEGERARERGGEQVVEVGMRRGHGGSVADAPFTVDRGWALEACAGAAVEPTARYDLAKWGPRWVNPS
jgi:hypothetical protein